MNPYGLNYDEDIMKLERYVYEAITKETAAQDESGAYIFKIASLPISFPTNSILRSKICRNLEEALEFRLMLDGKPHSEDEDEMISANVEVVEDILQVSI